MAKHVDFRASGRASRQDQTCGPFWLVSELLLDFYLGKLSAGDRLPPVRELAKQLQMSPTTALDLYKNLEAEGFVEGKERSGTFLKQVGLAGDRSGRERALFELLLVTARRLDLLGTGPRDFASLLLRLTGTVPRTDCRFCFLSHRESYEIFTRELTSSLRFELPIELMTPGAALQRQARERLTRNRRLRCLLTTYLYAEQAFEMAREFGLGLIVLRLDPTAAKMAQPPETGKRFVVMRDPDCAQAVRALICRNCLRVGKRACDDPYTDPLGPVAESVLLSHRCERTYVTTLTDEASLEPIDREASEVFASPLIVDQVQARFPTKTIRPVPSALSRQTVDDILFQYLFACAERRAVAGLRAG